MAQKEKRGKDDILSLLALSRIEGIGKKTKRELLENLSRPSVLFEGEVDLDPALKEKILSFDQWKALEKELTRLDGMGVEILTIMDEDYPALLKEIPDPPLVLYKKGPLKIHERTLAVVGTRKASQIARHLAEKISCSLASLGITIVSGLARGVDSSAHMGALREQGKTIAVLGCGIDICYPSENLHLFKRIEREGLLVTEYPLSSRPRPFHFPERNRIIAGLSRGILVIEASERSGSLITARLGLEYGREVMAIPGAVFDEGWKGSNMLMKEGARLVDGVEEILLTAFPDVRWERPKVGEMTEKEAHIYSLIGEAGTHVEEIVERSRMGAKEVMAILTSLALKDLIREREGGFFFKA